MRHRAGAVCRFPLPAGNTALGGTDGSDSCGGPRFRGGRRTLLWCYSLSRYAAYCRDLYRLYRGADDHHHHDSLPADDADGVLYLGGFLYLDLFPGQSGKLLRLGVVRVYRADHCHHHPD
ncbi:hypothetical protein D3C76_1559380 [compost metagenome]